MIMKDPTLSAPVLKSIQPPSKSRPLPQLNWNPGSIQLFETLIGTFSFSTLLLIGACVQTVLALLFQGHRYILLASFALVSVRLLNSFLIHYRVIRNPYLQDSIQTRYTALVPNEDGEIEGPSNEKVAITMLIAKSNHPFGFFAPQAAKTGEYFRKMTASLAAGNHTGFLGHTQYRRLDERGATELVLIGYWRSIEDVHNFAFSPVHKEGWQWWDKAIKESDYVGIAHEMYEADKKHWETVYANFQPTCLGATSYLRKTDSDSLEEGNVSEEWISPIIDASRGKLARASGRLGWGPTKHDSERPTVGSY